MIIKGLNIKQCYVVNEDIHFGFITIFKDSNPLHTNENFAIEKGFRSKVMHGNILNGFLSHFIGECLPTKNVIIHSQQINFNKPVYLNDILTLFATVEEIFESVNTAEIKFYFENQNNIKVAKGRITIGLI